MRINAVGVRKCGYCGRYFLPYSAHSKYCERIDPEKQKSCKDFAGAVFYDEKIANDKAASLYKKMVNTMNMRRKRSLRSDAQKKYEAWKKKAYSLLKQVERGEIGVEEFEERAKLVRL